jgi:predicted O-methyltransferase YrrM
MLKKLLNRASVIISAGSYKGKDLKTELTNTQAELKKNKAELNKLTQQNKELEAKLAQGHKEINSLKQSHQERLKNIEVALMKLNREQKKITPYVYSTLYSQKQEQSKIREIYLPELFENIDDISVPVGVVNQESGHDNQVDMIYVIAIAKYLKCKNIFEFGTYFGQTTYYLTLASDTTTVLTLDLPADDNPFAGKYQGIYFKGTDREPFIKQIDCDSQTFDTTPFHQQMELIFVDGDHSYEAVKNDTEKALEMLAPGGVIIWHDYAPKSPGVIQFFSEFSLEKPVFHIRKTCLLVYIDGVDPLTFNPHQRRVMKEWLKPFKQELLLKEEQEIISHNIEN